MTENKGDLISREALIGAIEEGEGISWERYGDNEVCVRKKYIDNAPTVEYTFEEAFQKTVCEQRLYCPQRPQGEREFIEILAEYCEDDYDTLPEYTGKPCYSIHYRENGKEFVGYGTYKIEKLSEYLRNYFFSADMRGKEE